MTDGITAERDRLRRAAHEADERHAAAQAALDAEWKLGAELFEPLWRRRYERVRPTEGLRRFTDELISQMRERGLAFDLSDVDRSLTVFDPAVRDEHEAATLDRLRARRELREFEREHADALDAEARAAEAQRIRDAIGGDDPDAMRRALAGAAA